MEDLFGGFFYNPSRGNLKIEQVMKEIAGYLSEKPDNFYEIIVGCDSSSNEDPHFPLVVAVLRIGGGGRFFLKKITYKAPFNRRFVYWKNRIMQEVLLSCEFAVFLRGSLIKEIEKLNDPGLRYQFRYIHADIGEKGQTREMVKELTGLIRGNGFEPKIKPESYIASVVADRYS